MENLNQNLFKFLHVSDLDIWLTKKQQLENFELNEISQIIDLIKQVHLSDASY